jgi:hypothetical protein
MCSELTWGTKPGGVVLLLERLLRLDLRKEPNGSFLREVTIPQEKLGAVTIA